MIIHLRQLILGILFLTGLSSCSVLGTNKATWNFIQSVGGIKTGTPLYTYDGWYLPIQCDVSGLHEITTQPTNMNSALECAKIDIKKKDPCWCAFATRTSF